MRTHTASSQVLSEATHEELGMVLPPQAVEKHQLPPLGSLPPSPLDCELVWRGKDGWGLNWVSRILGKQSSTEPHPALLGLSSQTEGVQDSHLDFVHPVIFRKVEGSAQGNQPVYAAHTVTKSRSPFKLDHPPAPAH